MHLRPRIVCATSDAGLSTLSQAAALSGRGCGDPVWRGVAAALAGGAASRLLAAAPEPLAPGASKLAAVPAALSRWPAGSMPHRFKTAMRSKSSGVSVAAFFTNLCFLRRSLRAWLLAAATCFCAVLIIWRAAAMWVSMSMGGLRLRATATFGVGASAEPAAPPEVGGGSSPAAPVLPAPTSSQPISDALSSSWSDLAASPPTRASSAMAGTSTESDLSKGEAAVARYLMLANAASHIKL